MKQILAAVKLENDGLGEAPSADEGQGDSSNSAQVTSGQCQAQIWGGQPL